MWTHFEIFWKIFLKSVGTMTSANPATMQRIPASFIPSKVAPYHCRSRAEIKWNTLEHKAEQMLRDRVLTRAGRDGDDEAEGDERLVRDHDAEVGQEVGR